MGEDLEDEELIEFMNRTKMEHEEKLFFLQHGLGPEVHWLLYSAAQALKHNLYLPACTSFLIGIEASIRVTMAQIDKPGAIADLNPRKLLSNRLIKSAKICGLPVEALAFPGEEDFLIKLESPNSQRVNVEVVRVRHNLCHGNVLEYINTDLGKESTLFTPECCRELADDLYKVSKGWATKLGAFRAEHFHQLE